MFNVPFLSASPLVFIPFVDTHHEPPTQSRHTLLFLYVVTINCYHIKFSVFPDLLSCWVTEIIHKIAYPEIDTKPETELADAKYDSKINPLNFISSIKTFILYMKVENEIT